MVRDTAYYVRAIRQLSNTEDDPAVTDPELIDRASDAKASLYDLILAAYEHYSVKSTDFSLAGGVGGNAYDLPSDFYKDVSLDLNPDTTPTTVHRMTSWVDRHAQRRRGYTLIGSQLVIEPALLAQGAYRLRYTPIDKPFAEPLVATTAYTPVTIDPTGGAVDGTLKDWFLPDGPGFDGSYALGYLNIAGAANAENNGHHFITSVPDADTLRTNGASLISESFAPGVTASAYLQPLNYIEPGGGGSNLIFYEADFTETEVGYTLTIAGSQGRDGTYTITGIIDAHTVQVAEVVADVEYFLPGVTVTYQPSGTVNELPQTMVPWYEYIQVHGAIAVKDKLEMPAVELRARLGGLEARIREMASNRMEEGGQIAMPNRRGGFWDDDDFHFGG